MGKLNDIDWHCDECNAYLNSQPGFNTNSGVWKCSECGYENNIDESQILSYDEYEEFKESGYETYNDYLYDSEHGDESSHGMSAYDAALIWASNGKDEDYMFGYTEEELEDALK